MAIPLVANLTAVGLVTVFHLVRADEVGERSASGEDAPVLGVVFVNVLEEAVLAVELLLADLAGEVMGSRQGRGM